MQLKINNQTYNLLSSTGAKEYLKGFTRDVITLRVEMTYQEAALAFTDGAVFTIIDDNDDQYEYTDYGVAGPITDNRDGTVTSKMGKNNTSEQDAINAKNEAKKQAEKVSMNLIILAGKNVENESDVLKIREDFETAATKLSDSDALIAPSLTKSWDVNQEVKVGDRRYYVPNSWLYKCLKDHKTTIALTPDVSSEYWVRV